MCLTTSANNNGRLVRVLRVSAQKIGISQALSCCLFWFVPSLLICPVSWAIFHR
jgi:hypothetical protein